MQGPAAGRDDRALRRIIAMLVALAALAEQAAVRSFPVRFLVLCILRHAEVVACAFVANATGMMRPVVGEIPAAGNGLSDAMLLAARLRALAAALLTLLRLVVSCPTILCHGAGRLTPEACLRYVTRGGLKLLLEACHPP